MVSCSGGVEHSGWGLENISMTGEVTLKLLQSIVFGASAAT